MTTVDLEDNNVHTKGLNNCIRQSNKKYSPIIYENVKTKSFMEETTSNQMDYLRLGTLPLTVTAAKHIRGSSNGVLLKLLQT
jgi:hypothetical protein